MAAKDAGNKWACPCLNVRVRGQDCDEALPSALHRIKVGSDAVHVVCFHASSPLTSQALPQLTTLETSKASLGSDAPSNATTVYQMHCRVCQTVAYTVPKSKALDIGSQYAAGFAASEQTGPSEPTGATVKPNERATSSVLLSSDGYMWLSPTCVDASQIAAAEAKASYSALFGVVLPSDVECSRERLHRGAQVRRVSPAPGAQMGPYALGSLPVSVLPAGSSLGASAARELDATALKFLREARLQAEREILVLTRRKQREMDELVQEAQAQTALLADVAASSRPAPPASAADAPTAEASQMAPTPGSSRNDTSPLPQDMFRKRRVSAAAELAPATSGSMRGALAASIAKMGPAAALSTAEDGASAAKDATLHAPPADSKGSVSPTSERGGAGNDAHSAKSSFVASPMKSMRGKKLTFSHGAPHADDGDSDSSADERHGEFHRRGDPDGRHCIRDRRGSGHGRLAAGPP